jgi:membrane protease YdiL (CAAX protease family)
MALACVAVVGLVFMARISLHRPPREAIVALLPRSSGEKIAFVLLCLLIGLTEEFVYRGFALSVLREWFRSDALAVAVVSVSFALMHGLQDFISIVSAFTQGLLLCVPVLCIQSLVPAITGHIVVDVFAALLMLSVLHRGGLAAE